MPNQPSWIQSVPQILEVLESPGAPPFVDRPTVEALFGVRRRQAIALLGRFGGYQVGRTFLAPRDAVVRFLREPQRSAAIVAEKARFERLRATLGQAREDLGKRRIQIPASIETPRLDLSGLSPGIRLEPAQLTIRFETPLDLLQKLFALSQALTNDYQTFEQSWIAANRPTDGS
jgi:hypothetical protein